MKPLESVAYEIAPGGDIEIVLNKPNEQNIIPGLRLSTDTIDRALHGPKFENPPCKGRYAVFSKLYEDPRNYKVLVRVSSSHLKFASRVFRVMLEGPWKEGASSSEPFRQINTTGWDVLAFVVVLDAIHGRHREIPDKPTLGLVTRIATVIDYYECHDALYVYFDRWLNHNPRIRVSRHALYKKTLLCLYIATVFSDLWMYDKMAKVIFRHSEGLSLIDTSDIPLGFALERIDEQRQKSLGYLFESLEAVEMSLLNDTKCPEENGSECICRALGGLMRAKYKLICCNGPLQFTHIEAPYNGYSIASFVKMIETIEKPTTASPVCTIVGRMRVVVKHVKNYIAGFYPEGGTVFHFFGPVDLQGLLSLRVISDGLEGNDKRRIGDE